MYLDLLCQLQLRQPPHIFFQDCLFDSYLMFVTGVLIMTATASLKVWTFRLNPRSRRSENLVRPCPRESRLFFGNCRSDRLALKHKGHEDRLAATFFVGG